MTELELYMVTQSWVNREYRRGMSMHPCGAPVLRITEVEMMFPTIAQGGVETHALKLNDKLGGYYGVES